VFANSCQIVQRRHKGLFVLSSGSLTSSSAASRPMARPLQVGPRPPTHTQIGTLGFFPPAALIAVTYLISISGSGREGRQAADNRRGPAASRRTLAKAIFVPPTVIRMCDDDMRIAQDEISCQ